MRMGYDVRGRRLETGLGDQQRSEGTLQMPSREPKTAKQEEIDVEDYLSHMTEKYEW